MLGLLRRLLGAGEGEEEPLAARARPADPDAGPAARIDAAKERLREEIPPLEDDA